LGVAVLFDRDTTIEIDGLRRALGEPDMARIPPHLTLVPPVNVSDVDAAERVVRAAARASDPFDITLGPVATFLPDNPVAYLVVSAGADAVVELRDAAFKPPLARTLSWPFVPHVTLADGIEPERVELAASLLAPYRRDVRINAVHLLEERGRVWEVLRAFPLGAPAVVGRGGDPLELDVLDVDGSVVITARREDHEVGFARGRCRGTHAWLNHIEVREDHRRGGIGTHLLAAFQSWAADRGATAAEVDPACDGDPSVAPFLDARGWTAPGDAGRRRRVL
jgi:2'-5' RNA ligase